MGAASLKRFAARRPKLRRSTSERRLEELSPLSAYEVTELVCYVVDRGDEMDQVRDFAPVPRGTPEAMGYADWCARRAELAADGIVEPKGMRDGQIVWGLTPLGEALGPTSQN